MSFKHTLMASAVGLLLAANAQAASITYTMNQTFGAGSVTGSITTDGTLGVLGVADITDFDLHLNGVGATYELTPAIATVYISGADLTATASDLYFDFSGGDSGYFLVQQGAHNGNTYYCDATFNGICYQGATVSPISIFDPSAVNVPETGNQIIASVTTTPEPAALVLLGTGLLGLVALRRRRG